MASYLEEWDKLSLHNIQDLYDGIPRRQSWALIPIGRVVLVLFHCTQRSQHFFLFLFFPLCLEFFKILHKVKDKS